MEKTEDKSTLANRFTLARLASNLTQLEVAERLGCSFQAVSLWERGKSTPSVFVLNKLAKLYNVSTDWLLNGDRVHITHDVEFRKPKRDRIFDEKRMYTYIKSHAQEKELQQTLAALPYAREKHRNQVRKGQDHVPFIYHPLIVACHALALGLDNDTLICAALLHDVCEDCKVESAQLPCNDEVKKIVQLLTKPAHGKLTDKEKKQYYDAVFSDPNAMLIKLLDRCNNVSSMATGFSDNEIIDYINETEKYLFPRMRIAKTNFPKYSNHIFLLKYHMVSVMESLKHQISA